MRNLRWHIIENIQFYLFSWFISKFNRGNLCFSFLRGVLSIILKNFRGKIRFIKIPLQWSRAANLEKICLLEGDHSSWIYLYIVFDATKSVLLSKILKSFFFFKSLFQNEKTTPDLSLHVTRFKMIRLPGKINHKLFCLLAVGQGDPGGRWSGWRGNPCRGKGLKKLNTP